ncbi:outer membrane protein, putative [Flavobacteriales bacterium ALC-1]|nr:outer membrane protein, putative [Flavobacteriales bacterium ALC-1]
MKLKIILTLFLLTPLLSFSQQGINYKALIKDDLGNVLTGQTIDIRFTILVDGGAGDYIEKHTTTTDTNGIVIVNIGQGDMVVQGDFLSIDWTTNITLLKTEIDLEQDGTYIEMGIEPFKFVPYAIQAINALEADVAKNVTGLEYIDETNDGTDNGGWRLKNTNAGSHGPIGFNALDLSTQPIGTNNGATGNYSLAFGVFSKASGNNAIALGDAAKALESNSVSIGLNSEASGFSSIAMGNNTIASGLHSISIGTSTEATVNYSIALGKDTKSSGFHSIATGHNTEATGYSSTAMGDNTMASGGYSTAIGRNTVAFDFQTFAAGTNTLASGVSSTALGNNTTALGSSSTSIGLHTIARSTASTALGKYNSAISTGLFVVGNGTDNENRKDAFIIKEDGKVGIGRSTPSSLFEVAHQDGVPTFGDRTNALSIRRLSNGRSWQFHVTSDGYLTLFNDGAFRGAFNATTGTYLQISDRKLKKDITTLEGGTLNKVLQLNPVSYLMKDQTDTKRNHGLISQEVKEIFPSITHYVKESDLLTLSYTELIPILIKAIQEQQQIIKNQNEKIEAQSLDKAETDKTLQALLKRIEAIENRQSN